MVLNSRIGSYQAISSYGMVTGKHLALILRLALPVSASAVGFVSGSPISYGLLSPEPGCGPSFQILFDVDELLLKVTIQKIGTLDRQA